MNFLSDEELTWLSCNSPYPMFNSDQSVSVRKLRQFGIACCRRIWHIMTDETCRRAVLLADGSKFERAALTRIADVSEVGLLIAADVPEQALEPLERGGIDVRRV